MHPILPALHQIEREHNVTVLLAVESGSRAWGFASQDSDWDVRFVYVHPRDAYLTVHPHRDVIEETLPGDLDLSGWDLPKALRLFQKTNPSMLEWFNSPLVYLQRKDLLAPWKELFPLYLSVERCHYHYFHMAEGNYRDYLQQETVWLKKYLYVVRPILACLYLEQHKSPPPGLFTDLVQTTVQDPELLQAVQSLVARKQSGEELASGPRIPVIDNFIQTQLPRLQSLNPRPAPYPSATPLDDYFRSVLTTLNP